MMELFIACATLFAILALRAFLILWTLCYIAFWG